MKHLNPFLVTASLSLLPVLCQGQDVRRGLVAYWPLDAVSGDGLSTPDVAPRQSDLTLLNMDASSVVAGKRGNGMSFDGANQLLFADTGTGQNPGLPLQANLQKTICMWVKADGTIQQDKRIFAEASSTATNPLFNMGTDSATTGRTGKMDIYIRSDAGTAIVNHVKSTGIPLDGNWHHLALTDDNGVVRYFIDGALDAATLSYTRPDITADRLSLGGIQRSGGPVAFFNGTLDDVALWNRILTPAEIQTVMASAMITPVPPVFAYVDRPGPYPEGDRVVLSVQVNGDEPLSWQWRRNGTNIAGATQSTYDVPALTSATAGDYSVVIDNSTVSTIVPLSFTADPAANPSASLVSWWPFNSLDESPFPATTPDPWGGHPLSCENLTSANLIPGKFGTAMEFDGISRIAHRTTGFPISSNPEYSVAFWVKADGSMQSDLRAFSEGSDASNTQIFTMGTVTDGSSHLRMYVRSDANAILVNKDSQSDVFDNDWHHVVWTDRNGDARLYIDGVMDGANFGYNRAGNTFTFNQTGVGGVQRAAASHWLTGAIDDVAVWNRALTWTEIQAIKTTGVPAPVAVVPPAITQQPGSQILWTGRAVTLSVQATGTAPFDIVWLKGGNPVPGANQPSLILDPATPADSGEYICKLTNSAGSATSTPATLTVRPIADINTGRVSTWPLDSGNLTTPDTVSGFDLTLANFDFPIPYRSGVKNSALFFDGTNDLATHTRTGAGNDIALTNRDEFTVAFWVLGSGIGQSDRRVFSENATGNDNALFNIGTEITGTTDLLYFYIRNDANTVQVNHPASFAPVFDGFWHHVIYTDYKGQGQLYVDGVADLTLNYSRLVSSLDIISLGGISRGTPSHWFAGGLDEVNTWERALSPEEAGQLFSSQPPIASTLIISSAIQLSPGLLQITVSTSYGPDASYHLQSSADLTANSWADVNDATLNPVANGQLVIDVPISQMGRRFYRVLIP